MVRIISTAAFCRTLWGLWQRVVGVGNARRV
jgi:hypothetical protein